jgi:hypothetical protein
MGIPISYARSHRAIEGKRALSLRALGIRSRSVVLIIKHLDIRSAHRHYLALLGSVTTVVTTWP